MLQPLQSRNCCYIHQQHYILVFFCPCFVFVAVVYSLAHTYTALQMSVAHCVMLFFLSRSIYGFPAGKGWDPVTGLGSPKFAQLLSYITEMHAQRDAAAAKQNRVSL